MPLLSDTQDNPVSETLETNAPIGRIVSVTGSQAIAVLDDTPGSGDGKTAAMGSLLTVRTRSNTVFGLVSAMSVPVPANDPGEREIRIIELELVGELYSDDAGKVVFRRGVSTYPTLGDTVAVASREQLHNVYASNEGKTIRIGCLQQDSSIPAMVDIDDLLGKHFAVLGSTGTGKSCTVALILRQILASNPQAHILLLDPHNEYASSFSGMAEVITPSRLTLPFWLFTIEEFSEVVLGGQPERSAEQDILSEIVTVAKHRYASNRGRERSSLIQRRLADFGGISADTPVPYRISELINLIQEQLGRLDLRRDRAPFMRLKERLESLSQDPRFAFMFGNLTIEDKMVELLGQLFRVPVNGRPITILELTGLPSDVVSVVVSVLCRMTFDFGLWSNGNIPVHLVCEEAHRYMPRDRSLGFEPAKRALSRIAKEGRKYGVSLSVVSQRPSELDPTILSQCNTIFALRMSNEKDQDIVKAAISDAAASLLDFLPSMSTGEAIAFGEGITLPGRIRFDRLPPDALPKGDNSRFSQRWSVDSEDPSFLQDVVTRWRGGGDLDHISPGGQPAPSTAAAGPAAQDAPLVAQSQPVLGDQHTARPLLSGETARHHPLAGSAHPPQVETPRGASGLDARNEPQASPRTIRLNKPLT